MLDFDGTIVKGVSWEALRKKYNVKRDKTFEDVIEGKITMNQLVLQGLENLLHLYDEKDFTEIMEALELKDGFEMFANQYFNKFDKVGILSGGFPPMVQRIADEYGIEAHTINYTRRGNFVDIERKMSGEEKKEILEGIAKDHRVIYVADEMHKGYEMNNYGKNVLRVFMDSGGEPLDLANFLDNYE